MIDIFKYDTIVFDYGGVIVNFEENFIRKTLIKKFKISPVRLWWYRRTINKLVRDFINGLRHTQDVIADMLDVLGKNISYEELEPLIISLAGKLPKSRLELITRLRKTHRVLLLSNINDILWECAVRDMKKFGYTPDDLFDTTFLSFEMGIAKPDAKIYETMINEAKIDPSTTLYLEDREENVKGGLKAGLQAVWVPTNCLEQILK